MTVKAPQEVHARFMELMNAGNLDALVALYEANARLFPVPGQPPVVGTQAIRQAFQQFFASKPTITIETQSVIDAGDIAYLRGKWRLIGTGPDGQPVDMVGQTAEVVRRQPDGTWRYVIDHPWGAD